MKNQVIDQFDKATAAALNADSPMVLREQLSNLAGWMATISDAYRKAETDLTLAKAATWGQGKTVDENKIKMDASVCDQQYDVNRLKDRQDMIKTQILLGQSMLKSQESELRINHAQS